MIPGEAVVTDTVALSKPLDLYTLKVGEGSCSSALLLAGPESESLLASSVSGNKSSLPFQLTATRHDSVHAFVFFFDCSFSKCVGDIVDLNIAPTSSELPFPTEELTKPLVLTTSPFHSPTHWRQTVCYLKQEYIVAPGQTIQGNVHFGPVDECTRDVNIHIDYSIVQDGKLVEREQDWQLRGELRYGSMKPY